MAEFRVFLVVFVALVFTFGTSVAGDKGIRKTVAFFNEGRRKVASRLHRKKKGETDSQLLTEVSEPREDSGNKVTIVGAGRVGTAVAFSLITQYVTDEIVLIDHLENVAKGEVQDLQHGTGFIKSPKISGGTDYSLSKNSKICIITAGASQSTGQSRLTLVRENFKIFKKIIPELIKHSPEAVFIIVTNPVDIMTYITWKLVNKPEATYRIIGSGTNLDSSRLRFLISRDLNISAESVHGWVIGEHGDSSVTAWSGVNIAGVNLRNIDEEMSKKMKTDKHGGDWFASIHEEVTRSAYDIISLKGCTSWAVGLSVANIAYSILHNVHNIHAVSTLVKGIHGIDEDVFLSLPSVLGEDGVTHIIKQSLEEEELEKLKVSANTLINIIKQLDWEDK